MTVDDLQDYGLKQMNDDEIRSFLSNQRMGVIGLPTGEVPYMLPMSFGFDGDSNLYFTFIGGPDSRKLELMEQTERARFLVYSVETMFTWESAMLVGTVEQIAEDEWEELQDVINVAWRPEVFQSASEDTDIAVYRFHIEELDGIKHTGLPPGFEYEADIVD